jgi:hypothetical protein
MGGGLLPQRRRGLAQPLTWLLTPAGGLLPDGLEDRGSLLVFFFLPMPGLAPQATSKAGNRADCEGPVPVLAVQDVCPHNPFLLPHPPTHCYGETTSAVLFVGFSLPCFSICTPAAALLSMVAFCVNKKRNSRARYGRGALPQRRRGLAHSAKSILQKPQSETSSKKGGFIPRF